MPRSSPYVITLTPKQRRVLEARARQYALPYRDVVRAEVWTASWLARPPLSSRNPLSPHDNTSSNF